MSFNGWKKVKLGEVADISSSKRIYANEYCNEGIPFYRSKEIIEKHNGNDLSTELFITYKRYKEIKEKYGIPNEGDILLTSVGTLGIPYIVQKEDFYFKDGNLTWIKNYRENCYFKFIYFWLQSEFGKKQISSRSIGSTQKALTIDALKKFDIFLPPLIEQKGIANILSSLDEKIEVNTQINKTLEAMAQELFKHWFVDFEFPNENGDPYKSSGGEMVESELGMIPKGWEVKELNNIGKLTMGLSPKSSSYNTDKIGIPLLNGAADFNNGFIEAKKYTTESTRLCKTNDLVFCIRATIGNITFADREYCLGRGVASITPKSKLYKGILYYNLVFSINKLISNATGSVILGLSKPDIDKLKMIIPDNMILNKFSILSNNILDNMHNNEFGTKELVKFRDSLLPKLMSGEIRVPIDKESKIS